MPPEELAADRAVFRGARIRECDVRYGRAGGERLARVERIGAERIGSTCPAWPSRPGAAGVRLGHVADGAAAPEAASARDEKVAGVVRCRVRRDRVREEHDVDRKADTEREYHDGDPLPAERVKEDGERQPHPEDECWYERGR